MVLNGNTQWELTIDFLLAFSLPLYLGGNTAMSQY